MFLGGAELNPKSRLSSNQNIPEFQSLYLLTKIIGTLIRIVHSPIEQIVIHEMVEYTLSDFVKHMTLGVAPEGMASLVKWCDGIVFAHVSLPSTADVVKDQMNGTVHWAWLSYAEMNSFRDVLESTHKAKIPLIDVSNNDLNKELVRWLKKKRIGR